MSGALLSAWRRLRSMFRDDALASDLDAEIESHIELAVEENVRRGMSDDEARRHALIRFGSVASAKEAHRDARLLPVLDTIRQDVRFALRAFRRERGFAAVVVLILAVGVGANVAVFGVVDALMLAPLPFPEPDRLAWVTVGDGEGPLSIVTYTVDAYDEYRRANRSFESLTCYNPFLGNSEYKLTGRGEPQPVAGVMVAENFFSTLGVRPLAGRFFAPDECVKGGPPVAVLSHAFWVRQFGGDPSVVGRAIVLGTRSVTVVGVLPESFDFGSVFAPGVRIDLVVPAPLDELRGWGNTLAIVGRLRPGVTVAQAQAEADVVFPRLRSQHPEWYMDYASTISDLKEHVSGKLRRPLVMLWGAVGLTFMIVCVNLSSLMLARVSSRGKEFAVRAALGAGRGRIVRQLATESVLLSLAGGGLGLAIALALTRYISSEGSVALPLLANVRLDAASLEWGLLVVAVSAVVFGLAPAFRVSVDRLQDSLKASGRGQSASGAQTRLRSTLVVLETALACMLLVGAGLLLKSLLNVLDTDLGFEPSHAVALRVDYDDGGDRERRGVVLEEMLDQVTALPGVEAAGVSDTLPLDRNRSWSMMAKGRRYPNVFETASIAHVATPGYFRAAGIRLVAGRDFDWRDTKDGAPVVVVNEAAARRDWPGENAVGKIVNINGEGDTTVIGVVADVRQTGLETSAGPELYVPTTQNDPEGAELVVRSTLPPDVVAGTVASALRTRGPNQLAAEVRPLQRLVDRAASPRRFFVQLVGAFAAIGMILAALGIYGVISYSVTSRTQEIGIRMALGATAGNVRRAVLARTMRLAIAGVALGTVGSIGAAAWISSMLYGTAATDPATYATTALLLGLVALAAGYIPARRASRIDPAVALGGW